jgi:trk system potassium uptake protein TrkA
MRIIIVGGGNVGYYLAKTLAAEKHRIMIVDGDRERCERIVAELNMHNIDVTGGDGTNAEILRDAGIHKADALIAVTGQDQNNFVACQLAKEYFGVKLTIARVNNPKNIRVFEKLGVDSVISSTARIAGIINQELDWNDVNKLLKATTAGIRIRHTAVEAGSRFDGRTLSEVALPPGTIIVSILRGDDVIIPGGDTRLEAGDGVIIVGKEQDIAPVLGGFQNDEE